MPQGTADFGTKGFWHNKNGLAAISDDVIAYVNTLDPYDSPTTFFESGDEPFNGFFVDGACVETWFNKDKITDGIAAGECTARAEISHFLTESLGAAKTEADHLEQLARQLLALIFKPCPDVMAVRSGSEWVSVEGLIDAAIASWEGTGVALLDEINTTLDGFNNDDALSVILGDPPPVVYP